jgi:hypothetical protein
MKFTARVSSKEDFDAWVEEAKVAPDTLDASAYDRLLKPSEANPAAVYSGYEAGLYDRVLKKYAGSGHEHGKTEGSTASPANSPATGRHEEYAH